jgi:5-formyltetrahydrofolate cyclo-ligase
MQSRAAIRRERKRARQCIPVDTRRHAASSVFALLRNIREYINASRVAVYFPMGGEMDTSAICADLWQRRKLCYLPRMIERPVINLGFARYTADTPMTANRFGIPEPDMPSNTWLSAQHLDLVLLPLVAFDRTGNRLGMGGGYYDSAMASRRSAGTLRRPRLYGLAYAEQEVANISTEPWDIPLDGIVTEQEIIESKNG